MKYLGLILLVATAFADVLGQAIAADGGGAIYLNKNEADIDNSLKRGYYVGPHILGDTITMLLNKFENDYSYYKESGGAYSTEEKIVLKAPIYKAVKKVNKYYEKGVKKNKLAEASSYESMKRVLNIAIKLRNYDTRTVEAGLGKLKTVKEIEDYLYSLKFR